jgi:putative peptidoglycan lipid II flippase
VSAEHAPVGSRAALPQPRLLASSAVMAVGTAVSRVLGFVRNVVLASAIGTAVLGDTFAVANSVPNIIYILVAGGVLNSVFVPQIVKAIKERSDGGDEYVHRLLTLTFLILGGLTVVATVGAPLIIRFYAADNGWPPHTVAVSTLFAYWCLPQILFYGVYTVLSQVLNARGRFGPMMWSPILNNLVSIATGLLFIAVSSVDPHAPHAERTISHSGIALLGLGNTLGVALQALVLVPVLRSSGYRYRPRLTFRGYGLGRAGRLAKWTLAFVAVNQLAYVVVVKAATAAGNAAPAQGVHYGVGFTAYTNAYLLFQLPHAIVAVSLVTALLPRMSAAFAEGRPAAVRRDFSAGLRLTGAATVPAAVAFLVLGPDITGLLYRSTGVASAREIGVIVAGFGLGLVAFSGMYLTHRVYYAEEDTRTPFLMTCVVSVVNAAGVVVCYWVLPVRWITTGMAASYAVSYYVGWGVSLRLLRRRLGNLDGHRVLRTHVRLAVASALAGVLALAVTLAAHRALGVGTAGSAAATLVGGAAMLTAFLWLAHRMRITELTSLLDSVRARLPR